MTASPKTERNRKLGESVAANLRARFFDADFMAGIDLFPQQIEFQSRVHLPQFCGVVTQAVMAAGKAGDGIRMSCFQHILPLFFIKLFADTGNVGRCVEIQMDLPET